MTGRLLGWSLGALLGLTLLASPVAAHGSTGHTAAEQLPYVLATLGGVGLVVVGAVGDHTARLSSARLADTAVFGGVALTVVGVVGYALL